MHEELIRKSLQKEVSRQEAQEKARRIKESKSQIGDKDNAKTKAIDMLVDVQKQLLDVFAISKVCFHHFFSYLLSVLSVLSQSFNANQSGSQCNNMAYGSCFLCLKNFVFTGARRQTTNGSSKGDELSQEHVTRDSWQTSGP